MKKLGYIVIGAVALGFAVSVFSAVSSASSVPTKEDALKTNPPIHITPNRTTGMNERT